MYKWEGCNGEQEKERQIEIAQQVKMTLPIIAWYLNKYLNNMALNVCCRKHFLMVLIKLKCTLNLYKD